MHTCQPSCQHLPCGTKYIVANWRPPVCDRTSNRNRVAHRSDNSVVTLLEQSPETSHGWVVNLTTAQSVFYPREIGSLAEYRYTSVLARVTYQGSVPRRRSARDTNRLSGPFRSTAITERVLSPTSPDPILFSGCLKPN